MINKFNYKLWRYMHKNNKLVKAISNYEFEENTYHEEFSGGGNSSGMDLKKSVRGQKKLSSYFSDLKGDKKITDCAPESVISYIKDHFDF